MAETTKEMKFVLRYLRRTKRFETLEALGVPGLPVPTSKDDEPKILPRTSEENLGDETGLNFMDASDDSILHPKAHHSHPNDVFEPNDSEIAIIESELPACDDSVTTSSQLFQRLLDDDSLAIPELNSESVSEPGPAPQLLFTTGDLQSKLSTRSLEFNKDLFADLDGPMISKENQRNKSRGLPTTGNKRTVTYGKKYWRQKFNEDDPDDDFSQELTSQYFLKLQTQKSMKKNAIQAKEKVQNGDEDDEFDFSAYKPPPKSSFKPPSKNASKIQNSVELLKRFDQSVATSLFTTGAGSSIALPGVPLPNNIQFPSVSASPKNPLKEVRNGEKAIAAADGKKGALSEIDMNQMVPESPRETSLDLSFDPSQALFSNSPYGASPIYKSQETNKPKKSSENLRKDIFRGLDDSFEFNGSQTGLGVPEAALQAVRAAGPGSKNTGLQNSIKAKIDESAIGASQQLLNTSNEPAASAKTADVDGELKPKPEEVNENLPCYQPCVNFFHPESDSIMHKYALLADKLRLRSQLEETQAKLTSIERSSSFVIPVKSAAKNNSKHSTLIPTRRNKSVKSPDLALCPMIADYTAEDEDFDMDLDEGTEDRVMTAEEIKQLKAMIKKIDEEIDCRKKCQENRYGVLFQSKKHYNQRGKTIPVSQFKPQVNTEDKPADPVRNFNLLDFWPKEDILAGKKTSDDGTFSCAADGTFGSRHIQRTLHSSTINRSLHSKLSINWVENHAKLVKQKLAGYNNYLDHELREKVFTPDALVDQLRLRADLEFIDGKRSLIVKISEHEVSPAMPAVLYISSKEPLRLSDGWYEIKCDGDALIKQRLEKLPIGSKILICGATLARDAQASHPLKNISEIQITANSTKRVKWHTKLGPFFKSVPPSTLSSISSSGGSIYKLKLKITRKYPDIWLQDKPGDRRVVFSKRQRDRWLAQKEKDLDKQRESLAASIRKKHRESLNEDLSNLKMKEIRVLEDPEEIYTAVTLSKDREHTFSNLTEEQRQKYRKFAEEQKFKINESLERELRQSRGKTTKKLRFKVKEGNRTSILQIDESKLRDESLKAGSIVIVEMANIGYRGQIVIQKNGTVRVFDHESVKPELPAEYSKILHEIPVTTKEVDIVGIVVHLTPSSCVLADNKKQFVTVQLDKSTWDFEALNKIVLVGAVLAFKNLEVGRQKAAQLKYTHVSEVLSKLSDFQGSSGALFNLFNAYNKVLARSGHENLISAFRSSSKSSSFSTPTRPCRILQ
ncbi:Oidioi.mRNA.OKI2018_I69.PAR.g8457.t1.cds [Oikopleura dioica]|uniref:Oidioi.mRNA.OKI2018_I69.PAR.g8457.t1.cds n=1 Tax=Oikopleura dioica TaxID=34765 RepID=A0ABN7RH29_OIKDI|nr:Oidioi.mRNA.OKI2018_I69.PAR.g8457.t1.cds [Oikopleura dioica]